MSKQRFLDVPPLLKVAPDVPHAVAMVVNKAMMLNPARRYQSPSEMVQELKMAETHVVQNGNRAATAGKAASRSRPADAEPVITRPAVRRARVTASRKNQRASRVLC